MKVRDATMSQIISIQAMDDYEAVCDYLQYEKSIGCHTKKQIATLLHTDSSGIKIHIINTQRQTGGSDCGLFAIAFARQLLSACSQKIIALIKQK